MTKKILTMIRRGDSLIGQTVMIDSKYKAEVRVNGKLYKTIDCSEDEEEAEMQLEDLMNSCQKELRTQTPKIVRNL